eukprot:TRINITY_DN51113_c0_g1_i1.p1 TRINITY_DN51113_c0_g1~~TRINITY_DN51113_c0_g1_i1.p1  ORF type:complete len:635 (+),score=233.90 TRINITY_DN51113_c0_g1_i1:87-1907(+)
MAFSRSPLTDSALDVSRGPRQGPGQSRQLAEPVLIRSHMELNFGLRWDFLGEEPIDLDASCVSFDVAGNPGEVVFYNNLQTRGEWMVHTGDNTTGEGDEDDEAIQVFFNKVPPSVAQMILVVTCHNEGCNLGNVKSVVCVVTDMATGEIFCPEMDVVLHNEYTAIILCSLCRKADGSDWELRELNVPAEGHSVGETRLLQKMQDQLFIPPELMQQRKQLVIDYDVKKGEVAQIPLDLSHLMMGLGWTREDSDLDASAVMLDKDGWYRDHVSAKKKHLSQDRAISHSGDNAFEGQGDKETIHVKLDSVHPDVHYIMFAVTHVARENDVWNNGRLGATQGAYCRLAHITKKKNLGKGHTHNLDDRKELCRTNVSKLPRDASALIFAAVYRDPSRPGGWSIKKIGEMLNQSIRESALPGELLPTMRCICYYLRDRFKEDDGTWIPGGWGDFRAATQKRFMLQVTACEARGLAPQDAEFRCHLQIWVMDRERQQRRRTRTSSDRRNPSWNESFDFKVTAADAIRVLCFEWGSVGLIDIPLAAPDPMFEGVSIYDTLIANADQKCEADALDRWFPLVGHGIEGEVRLRLALSSAPLRTDDDDESAFCCSVQ